MRAKIMGIVNATEDSFFTSEKSTHGAFALGEKHLKEGADILDLGAESTRPGAQPLSAREEINKLVPLIKEIKLKYPSAIVSIDTYKAETAEEMLTHGADIINDISALADKGMAKAVAKAGCKVVLMHMRGTPLTMDACACYDDIIKEIKDFFEERISFALANNIKRENIILDPGFGFAKTKAQNMFLLKHLDFLKSFNMPVLAGLSRKRFLSGDKPEDRLFSTMAANILAYEKGASIFRVHDVAAHKQAFNFIQQVRNS